VFFGLLYAVPSLAWCAGVFALLQAKSVRAWFARPYRFDDE
jgi:hypothetical protein